jgi:3'(2'), 5'-bisphosphate nucleotidase
MNIDNEFLLEHFEEIRNCILDASEAILTIYNQDFKFDTKSDDTPVTKADLAASDIISSRLKSIFPMIPVITEEIEKDYPYKNRKDFAYFWSVDPLDGTKHFISKDGQFSINIALIANNKPVFGLIYSPIEDILYFGAKDCGAFKIKDLKQTHTYNFSKKINCKKPTDTLIMSLGAKSKRATALNELCDKISKDYIIENTYKGSSLKMCDIAEGNSHIYPRFGKTSEWDTAAAEIILNEAGAYILNLDNVGKLLYNKENFLNPSFIATSLPIGELKGYI